MDFLTFLETEINKTTYDFSKVLQRIDDFISNTKAKVFFDKLIEYVALNYGP